MAEIIPRLTTGGRTWRDAQGWHATEVWDVGRVGGPADSREYRACTTPGVPQYAYPHPAIPGIRVISQSAVAAQEDPNAFLVTLEYGGDTVGTSVGLEGTGIKSVETSSSTVRTRGYRDRDGRLMVVVYQGPEIRIPGSQGGMWSPATQGFTFRAVYARETVEAEWDVPTQTVTVTVERPRPSFLESYSTATLVNADTWSGLPPYTWLSLGIDSTLNAQGTYDWREIFAIAPRLPNNSTWRFRAEQVVVGNSVREVNTLGNGIEFFDLYQEASFLRTFGYQIPT